MVNPLQSFKFQFQPLISWAR